MHVGAPWNYLTAFRETVYYVSSYTDDNFAEKMNSDMLGYYIWITLDKKNIRTTIVLVFEKQNVPDDDKGKNLIFEK